MLSRETLVDDGHWRRSQPVGAGKHAAFVQGHLVDLEEVGRHDAQCGGVFLAAWYRGDLLDTSSRKIVLALRQHLEKPHVDRVTTEDYERREPGRGWLHVDYPIHQDHGIGVGLEGGSPPRRRVE